MFTFDSMNAKSQRLTGPLLASAAIVVLAAIPFVGCSKADGRVPVHPTVGKIQFNGQPTEGAFVFLFPKRNTEGVPNPRATVGKDGSFTLSTYDSNNGAPAGEYVVTVQWYKPVRQGNELVGGPNVIPPKYASPRTSNVTVRVAAGENRLPTIKL